MKFIIAIVCFFLSASYSYTLATGPENPYNKETISVNNIPVDGMSFAETKDTTATQQVQRSNIKSNVAIITLLIICGLLIVAVVILLSAIKSWKLNL